MPKLTQTNDELQLSLSGATDFQDALARVKSIPGRRFDPDSKLWKFPRDPSVAERLLLSIKPTADASIIAWVRSSRAEREQELTTKIPDDAHDLLIPWQDKLFDFQRALVRFVVDHPNVILADDMGLGKTVQCLSAVSEYLLRHDDVSPQMPRLVLAPNSAKGVWAREIRKWLGDNEPHQIIDAGTAGKREAQLIAAVAENAWVIVNWEQIRAVQRSKTTIVQHRDGSASEKELKWWEMRQPIFTETEWLAVIADEAHRAKNRKALVTQGLWMLDAPIKIAPTGTPLMNAPDELWPVLHWLFPEQYGNSTPGHPRLAFWAFSDQYTHYYEGYKGSRVVLGVQNPDALRFELKDRLVRRTKAEKLNLPDITREYVPLQMNKEQAKIYSQAESDFWLTVVQTIKDGEKKEADAAKRFMDEVLTGTKRIYEIPNGAARTVRLRQVLCSPALLGGVDDSAKLDAILENILDNSSQQHIVFTEFVGGANLLVERLRKKNVEAEAFTGEVKDTAIRTDYENKFQAGEIEVLVGTLGAMREGLTLTAANIQHFCERAWVPGWNEQAEGRCHRQGQKNPVTALIYVVEDSVDTDKVEPTNQLKELIVSSVIKKDEVKVAV